MPTSEDLKFGDFFFWAPPPPPYHLPSPLSKTDALTPPPPTPPCWHKIRTILEHFLSCSLIGWTFIQPESRLYCNDIKRIFFGFRQSLWQIGSNRYANAAMTQYFLNLWNIWVEILAYCTNNTPNRFHPGGLVTRTGDREIHSGFGRLPDNPGELAWVEMVRY